MATEKILIFDEAGNAKRMKVRIARFLDNEPVTATDKENIRTTLDVDGSQSGTFTTPLSVTSASDSSFTGGGKVGIGSSSPSYELDVTAANARIAATSSAGVVNHLQADSTGAWVGPLSNHNLYFKTNNTTRWTINTSGSLVSGASEQPIDLTGNGILQAANSLYLRSTGSSPIIFQNGSATRWTIDTSGNFVSSGGGIDFGSGASTTLDAYEEGTFTVTTNSDATGAIGSQLGEYTKIGRLVTVRITFTVTTNFTANAIGGLPFQVDAPNTGGSSVSTGGIVFSSSTSGTPLTCHTNDNTTTVKFLSGTSVATDHLPNTSNSTYRIQFSYNTD